MPKQPIRIAVAPAPTVQDPADQLHCRKLLEVLQGAGDKARLRGNFNQNVIELRTQPHRDPLIRRLFSRHDIALERLAVRSALINAASNVTPERLRGLGSPGRLAVRALRDAGNMNLDRDVKAGQVRSATALLAGGKKKRAYIGSPVKSRSAWLAQAGANTLASADGARRVQLRRFCVDSSAAVGFEATLGGSDDPGTTAASISIFRAAALSFIVEDMSGSKQTPLALAAQIGKRFDSKLLRLFSLLWLQAVAAGKITKNDYVWFDAVDWLVNALRGTRPMSPGATRAPKSARVVSPVAAPLARAHSPAPAPEPAKRRLKSRASMPVKPARNVSTPRQTRVARAAPSPGRPQQGRQAVSLRMLHQLRSPTRLPGAPEPQVTVAGSISRTAAPPAPAFKPAAGPASVAPVVPTAGLLRTATLLEVAIYLASRSAAPVDGNGADSQLLGGSEADALPDKGE